MSTDSVRWHQMRLRQFTDVLIVILGVAGLVSLVVGETTNVVAIFVFVVLNGLLGFTHLYGQNRYAEARPDDCPTNLVGRRRSRCDWRGLRPCRPL